MNKRMSKKRGHSHGHCVIGRMRISPVFSFQVLPLASWASSLELWMSAPRHNHLWSLITRLKKSLFDAGVAGSSWLFPPFSLEF